MIKVFISQPMRGKTEEEILRVREKVITAVKENLIRKSIMGFDSINVPREDIDSIDVQILDSYFADYNPDAGCVPLKYLAKSLEILADADVAYFAKGWQDARGCRIENECAIEYGIEIIEDYTED